MVFVRTKVIAGHTYYYRVRSVREGEKVRQVFVSYVGRAPGGHPPPPETKPPPPTEKPLAFPETKTWEGHTMRLRGVLDNGTPLYVQEGVRAENVEDYSDSFNRLPKGAQDDIQEVDVLSSKGKSFRIGGGSTVEAGHFDPQGRVLRIFDGASKVYGYQAVERILVHEAGHGMFRRYSVALGKFQQEATAYANPIAMKAYTTADTRAKAKREVARERHIKESDALFEKYDALKTRRGEPGVEERVGKLEAEIHTEEDRFNTAMKELTGAAEGVYSKVRAEENARYYKEHLTPPLRAYDRYLKAADKEGPLTAYAGDWKKKRGWTKVQWYNENFAEAMQIWYSASGGEYAHRERGHYRYLDAQGNEAPKARATEGVWVSGGKWSPERYEREYPETFRAWSELMEHETDGHAVPLKYAPKRRLVLPGGVPLATPTPGVTP